MLSCNKCHLEKPETSFYHSKYGTRGRRYICIDCEKEYAKTHKLIINTAKRKWKRKWREQNPKKSLGIDLTGRKINRFTVIELLKEKNKFGQRIWKCQCSCGNVISVTGQRLLAKKNPTRSCGCHIQEQKQRTLDKFIVSRCKRRAKTWNIDWNLSNEYALSLLRSPCFYCGKMDFREIKSNDTMMKSYFNGIDRVDNSVGYIVGNVVSCCKECNIAKGAVTVDIMIKATNFLKDSITIGDR